MKTKLFFTGLALMAVTVFANAQDPATGRGNCNGQRNGKCDGSGKGQGQGKGQGSNFVDANKNGICDTYVARIKK